MANETVYANAQTVAAYLDAEIMDALRENIVVLSMVKHVLFRKGSDSIKLRKKGTLTATSATEATAHAKSQYAQTSPATLQVQQAKVYVELSKKARRFSDLDIPEIAEEAARAILDYVEQTILSLGDGFSASVGTSGQDLTVAVLKSAFYTLRANNVRGPYVGILHATQLDNVTDDLITTGAPIWSSPNVELSILNSQAPQVNGWAGRLLGVDLFQSNNVESLNTDADWGGIVMDPRRAIAFGDDGRGVETDLGKDIEKGVDQIAVDIFFDAKEADDAAGVSVISGQ